MNKLKLKTACLIEKGHITGSTILSDYKKYGYIHITYIVSDTEVCVSDIEGFSPSSLATYKRYPTSRMDFVYNSIFIERFFKDLEDHNKVLFPKYLNDEL